MDDIGFFFDHKGKTVQLPVNPSEVAVTYSGNNKTQEIITLGQINILRDRKLADVSFSSFFPAETWYPGIKTTGSFEGPDFYKDFFLSALESKEAGRLVVTGIGINMEAAVEKFVPKHKGGDHEDCYYELSFREYKAYGIKTIVVAPKKTVSKTSSAKTPVRSGAAKSVTIGCDVIVNGRLHYTSLGDKPGQTVSNYRGKINFIQKGAGWPYHVTTPSGGWLGWVTASSVKVV